MSGHVVHHFEEDCSFDDLGGNWKERRGTKLSWVQFIKLAIFQQWDYLTCPVGCWLNSHLNTFVDYVSKDRHNFSSH